MNNKQQENLKRKSTNGLDPNFLKGLKILASKKMQIKNTLRFHFPTIGTAIIRNINGNQ